MRTLSLLLLAAAVASAQTGTVSRSVDPATQVLVIVNDTVPEGLEIARHYCRHRAIPEANVLRLSCPGGETVTWPEFRESILAPFTKFLEKFPEALYVVPVYGVPLRISVEKAEKVDPAGLGNAACVDAELALALQPDHEIHLWLQNPLGGKAQHVTRADNVLLVSRLDGPTPAIARALVDKAIYAETYGLSGKAYLDTRGFDEDGGSYGSTDEEMRLCLGVWQKYGFEAVDEDTPTLVDVSKCTDALFYWGWYTGTYNGTEPFQFNPGAVGAHLHSFSATTIRSDKAQWAGPLLAHGITCTLGTVWEPYTVGFPAMYIVYDRMFQGYTWGEATMLATRILSWMCVFCGDPLYAPWAEGMAESQAKNRDLAIRSFDRVAAALDANDAAAARAALAEVAALPARYEGAKDLSFLERELAARLVTPGTGTVADLQKALAEAGTAKDPKAALERALAISPMNYEANLALGKLHAAANRHKEAIACLEKAGRIVPDSPAVAEPLGRALIAAGRFKEAIPLLKAAVDNGAGAECLEALGDACLKAGDAAQAVQHLAQALKRDPANRAAALLLAKAHDAARDPAGALTALQAAVAIVPESHDDVPSWKGAWKSLATAADRAKNKAEKDRASLALADLDHALFAVPSRGVALKICETVENLRSQGTPLPLAAPAQEALKGTLLPRIMVGNASGEQVVLRLKGPLPREIALAPFTGAGDPPAKELGLVPGEYDVVIEATKGKERRTAAGHFRFEAGARYGFVVDGQFGLTLPKPKK